ncbi:MAG: Hsp20/alpha crystallin family protein, partial [Gammaproteobacteria bacterium]|nr:Hsp20/alpha crystallin family protein [Gammaproteobacteria bacterium]
DPDTVTITLNQSILSVSVERPELELPEGQTRVRSEIQAYLYSREFELPEDAAPTDIKASSKNGILELTIARKMPAPPKKIKVKQH